MDPKKPTQDFEPNEAFLEKFKKYFLKLFNNKLPSGTVESKKKLVWQRIDATIDKQENKTSYISIGLAASISLLIGFSVWLILVYPTESEMEVMAGHWSIGDLQDTQLIISEDQTYFVKGEESVIDYTGDTSIAVNDFTTENNGGHAFNSLIVPYGKRSKLLLEDGSIVWINSGSKLIYPTKFGKNTREIFLEGEAYFEVSADEERPFIVQTKDMNIKVLGTEFNISAYRNEKYLAAVLVHGSIEMNLNKQSLFNKKRITLKPNERALYSPSDNTLQLNEVDTEFYVSWKDGYMKFNNSKLQNIIKQLEKQYAIQISLNDADLLNKTFTGKLDLKQDIDEVINIICATTSLTYTKTERRFLLDKK